jgi:hypothetical protein
MSLTTLIIGIAPPNAVWKAHKAVWDACDVAKVDVPTATYEFFNEEAPDKDGVVIHLMHLHNESVPAGVLKEWSDDDYGGYEVDLDELHKAYPQVTKLRFVQG